MTPSVSLIPFDADRATITAWLDTSPVWKRADITQTSNSSMRWKLDDAAIIETYDYRLHISAITLPTDTAAPYVDAERMCYEAALVINAVALRLRPGWDDDAVERLTEIYRLAAPGSDIALIASGLVEPQPLNASKDPATDMTKAR